MESRVEFELGDNEEKTPEDESVSVSLLSESCDNGVTLGERSLVVEVAAFKPELMAIASQISELVVVDEIEFSISQSFSLICALNSFKRFRLENDLASSFGSLLP